jgi:hypothetical protein
MCGACHRNVDPEFPSTLLIPRSRDNCGACHSAIENADLTKCTEGAKRVRIASIRLPPAQAQLEEPLRAALEEDLANFGILQASEGGEELAIELALEFRSVRGGRFMPPGRPVVRCWIDARLTAPGATEAAFSRRAASAPEQAAGEEEAARLAVLDAYRVLRTQLIAAIFPK